VKFEPTLATYHGRAFEEVKHWTTFLKTKSIS